MTAPSRSGPVRRQKEVSQRRICCRHRSLAKSVKRCWNAETLLASTISCGRLLYISIMANTERLYSARCWVASSQCPYSCLLCPKPRSASGCCESQGRSCSKLQWHRPSTLLWRRPNIPMFLLRTDGAKLNSRKAVDSEISSFCRKLR